ncbi:hypothetical protein [Sphingomonas sp. HMP6]|nr:hypothetical protein [Sphingomonas sp. HMP6]
MSNRVLSSSLARQYGVGVSFLIAAAVKSPVVIADRTLPNAFCSRWAPSP